MRGWSSCDEQRLATYILTGHSVSPQLKRELGAFLSYRTATFAARRQGGAVQSISAEADKTALLRFYGYLERLNRIPENQLLTIAVPLCKVRLSAASAWAQSVRKVSSSVRAEECSAPELASEEARASQPAFSALPRAQLMRTRYTRIDTCAGLCVSSPSRRKSASTSTGVDGGRLARR